MWGAVSQCLEYAHVSMQSSSLSGCVHCYFAEVTSCFAAFPKYKKN